MLRRLAPIFIIFSLIFLPLFFAPKVSAALIPTPTPIETTAQLDAAMEENGMDKYLKEFCAKRQGNQMNLETWYSGKCPEEGATFDTFSGEGVGFSDIVILDLAEKLVGKSDPNKSFSETLKDILKGIKNISSTASPQEQQLALDSARQKLFSQQDPGLIGQTGKMIGMLFKNQPASTKTYLAYITNNLQRHKIIPQALAATGVGFSTFSPFLPIWIAFRNLAYLGVVIFFIVYGFMMMFRVNLGQKTVISVQLAIPKLIVTLLIITFSYAIVGLIFDLMWVVIYFVLNYLDSQKIINNGPTWHPAALAGGNGGIVLSLIINAFVAGPAALFGVLNLIFGGFIGGALTIVTMVTGLISGFGLIIALIIAIAVLISYAKLFFKLVSAFISIVISLITGPLVLLGNAFPGSQVIGTWFRSILANISVFPITMLLLLFSYLLMMQPIVGLCTDSRLNDLIGLFTSDEYESTRMTPCEAIFGVANLVPTNDKNVSGIPMITPPWVGFDARGLLALLGVGLLLMASKYVDIVRDALKVPPFKYGADISKALEGGLKGTNWVANKIDPTSQASALTGGAINTVNTLKKT